MSIQWALAIPSFAPKLFTSVTYDASGSVLHTTAVKWFGIPLLWGRERLMLSDDGNGLEMKGHSRS
ncbi:MAG: hypothetical protein KC561_20770, partial [Myxococcales bacterium]|nr:hypothetical protein [Myxococcales bacterium]